MSILQPVAFPAPPLPPRQLAPPPPYPPLVQGAVCPVPLLNSQGFRLRDGYTSGRICGNWTAAGGAIDCCLPCPTQDWFYDDGHATFAAANVIGAISLACSLFLLVSWVIFPADRTKRTFLGTGVLASLSLISLTFAITSSSGAQDTCFDPVTPHSAYSSPLCGATGILLHFSSLSLAVWMFLTSIWVHARLVWEVEFGQVFNMTSVLLATTIPMVFVGATIATASYSYGVFGGSVCTINAEYAAALLWAWLVGCATASLFLLTFTFLHCGLLYLRVTSPLRDFSHADMDVEHRASLWKTVKARVPGRLSLSGLDGKIDAKCLEWIRKRAVLRAELGSLVLAVLVPLEMLLVAAVGWAGDERLRGVAGHAKMDGLVRCLVESRGQVNWCREEAEGILMSQGAVLFALVLLTSLGFQFAIIHILRPTFLRTWKQIIQHPVLALKNREFPPLTTITPPSQTTLPSTAADLANSTLYTVDQPSGSLRQLRRPSLPSRMRTASCSLQLEDMQSSKAPSPISEEVPMPIDAFTNEANPYGYFNSLPDEPQSVFAADQNPFAGSTYSMHTAGPNSPRQGLVTIIPAPIEDDRPVSPVSPIDNDTQHNDSRFSWLNIPTTVPGRPISPHQQAASTPSSRRPSLSRRASIRAHAESLRKKLTPRAGSPASPSASEMEREIPEILRIGHVALAGAAKGRPRNASVVEPPVVRRDGDGDGDGVDNPLRMNAVEPFRSRRMSQG